MPASKKEKPQSRKVFRLHLEVEGMTTEIKIHYIIFPVTDCRTSGFGSDASDDKNASRKFKEGKPMVCARDSKQTSVYQQKQASQIKSLLSALHPHLLQHSHPHLSRLAFLGLQHLHVRFTRFTLWSAQV